MTTARYRLADHILIEEHAGPIPSTTFTHLSGYPDESRWRFLSGPASVEDGVLVLDDESPAANTSRAVEEADAEAFLADLAELDEWEETDRYEWESERAGEGGSDVDEE